MYKEITSKIELLISEKKYEEAYVFIHSEINKSKDEIILYKIEAINLFKRQMNITEEISVDHPMVSDPAFKDYIESTLIAIPEMKVSWLECFLDRLLYYLLKDSLDNFVLFIDRLKELRHIISIVGNMDWLMIQLPVVISKMSKTITDETHLDILIEEIKLIPFLKEQDSFKKMCVSIYQSIRDKQKRNEFIIWTGLSDIDFSQENQDIKELRQSGQLMEALRLAKKDLDIAIKNINHDALQIEIENILSTIKALAELEGNDFEEDIEKESLRKNLIHFKLEGPKRNISWVYYSFVKKDNTPEQFDTFISWLDEIAKLELPNLEKLFYEKICWQIGKMVFSLCKIEPTDTKKIISIFEITQSFHFQKPSAEYSFLFKAFHKSLKDTEHYVAFADWWGFQNFLDADFEKEKIPNSKEVMAIAEQAYIAYAKNLLPKYNHEGNKIFNRHKAEAFLPLLSEIVDNYPQFHYPAYFKAKLLLSLGDKDNMLESLIPFAKKKRNDFWIWEIIAEAFPEDSDMFFACYCKALSCKSLEQILVNLRQKMAKILIAKKLHNEAKTEIELLVKVGNISDYILPDEVAHWQDETWFKTAVSKKSNLDFYTEYSNMAESILFSDIAEEIVFVEFVNSSKKILHFISADSKVGFFKYDRFLSDVKVGDTLKVRFQGESKEGRHQVYTTRKLQDEAFKMEFMKDVSGIVKIPEGKSFGFVDSVYIHPNMVSKYKLIDGCTFKGQAIKSYNPAKKSIDWKLI